MERRFTISVLTVREASALLRVIATIGRHRLGIESVASGDAGDAELSRHTVVVRAAPDRIRRAMKQLGSALGVVEADYYPEGETLDREMALYKLSVDLAAGGEALERLVRQRRARVVLGGPDYVVIEKTGGGEEIDELLRRLEPFGVIEFARTGRVRVTMAAVGTEIGTE